MSSGVEYFIERTEKRKKYFVKYKDYCRLTEKELTKKFGSVRVIVFGSTTRGDYNPALSDIGILVVTSRKLSTRERAVIINFIKNKIIQDPEAPFEIHIASEKEYREWYKKFIDEQIEI